MIKSFLNFCLIFFVFVLSAEAENNSVKAFIDTNNVLIGDQLTLTISAITTTNKSVRFPIMPDSIGKIVFLNTIKSDTLADDKQIKYTRRVVITSFDSGEYVIPGFPIIIEDKKNSDTLITNNLYLKFRTVKVDTSQGFKDIKPIMDVPWSFWDLLPYIIVLLAAALLLAFIIYLKKKFKKRDKPLLDYDPNIPPNLLAIEALKQLEAEKLWQNGFIKQFHSQLSEILRTYIERQFSIIALELTTIEIIEELQNAKIDIDAIFVLKRILELADLVKFAKYQPIPDEHSASLKNAFEFVNLTSVRREVLTNNAEENNV